MKKLCLYFLTYCMIASSCHSKTEEQTTEEETETVTPVTVATISTEPMAEYIELNATSTFLQQAVVKASSNGYVTSVNAQKGRIVSPGQVIFVLKTKEAMTLGNTINLLDSSFKFSGIINIKTATGGYVSDLSHQKGDYVQEGEQLATISDLNSFVFVLNMPYELRPYVLGKGTVDLMLPDGNTMKAHISSVTPVVDSISQTQNVLLTVGERNLPVNLVGKVRVAKNLKTAAISLPKQAVLADETQSNFWVMKLIDDSTAVKVPVEKGMEAKDKVEIVKPAFSNTDRFLVTGNFGLGDTAKVRIVKE
ncbi:MAG TPA: efflux RND transporter periplasmic adaptor subunit [Chitinophagaceae bacterium]|nr:efflux RND transporter periplasmic adaptor subunit [Chitinophagaceae bacterium]